MMRPRDQEEWNRLDLILHSFHENTRPLPGIQTPENRTAFLEQLLESIHRVRYIGRGVLGREISDERRNPQSELFDPVKASALFAREGEHDEACWQVFLFTHFGKNLRTGYRLTRDVYGGLGNGPIWNWNRMRSDPEAFRHWLAANLHILKSDGVRRYFGNHRKYQSLDPYSAGGTGEAFVSYVGWVLQHDTHRQMFTHASENANGDPYRMFRQLYRSMDRVASFGRTAKVDYLCMLAKLDLADIEPDSCYMSNATGPLVGARLLFGDDNAQISPKLLDDMLVELGTALQLEMCMQILEDSLCNWQKSPGYFIPFRG